MSSDIGLTLLAAFFATAFVVVLLQRDKARRERNELKWRISMARRGIARVDPLGLAVKTLDTCMKVGKD